jgi:hypothetical protein
VALEHRALAASAVRASTFRLACASPVPRRQTDLPGSAGRRTPAQTARSKTATVSSCRLACAGVRAAGTAARSGADRRVGWGRAAERPILSSGGFPATLGSGWLPAIRRRVCGKA